jgi:hypothetical protein
MICDNLKILFLEPTRTATTSIGTLLASLELDSPRVYSKSTLSDNQKQTLSWQDNVRHKTWNDYINVPRVQDYIHLITIRNPYDRVISEFRYQLDGGRLNDKVDPFQIYQNKDINLAIRTGDIWANSLEDHNATQSDYLSPTVFIIKMEEINTDWESFTIKHNLKTRPVPRLNPSNIFTSNITLTDESKYIIYNKYKEDFDIFGYNE